MIGKLSIIELESSIIQIESSLIQLEHFLNKLESCTIEFESSLINWVYVKLAFHTHHMTMERQIDINSINWRAILLIRELFSWIRQLCNTQYAIRELSNCIKELSNWIESSSIESESSQIELECSLM